MPQQERVKPGDLITSDFMNAILDRLDKLEEDMGSATSKEMVITFPAPGVQLHMKDTLHITGKGFGVPAADVVTIDAAQQTVQPGGSDSEIIVKIDGVQSIGNGKTVSLLVTNPSGGTASTQFTLLPFVPDKPTGNLKISLSKAPPDLTMDGRTDPYLFTFRIHAETTLPDDYNLTATIDQLTWTALTVDSQLTARPTINIPTSPLPNGSDQDVLVSLTIPQGAANGTIGTLTLNVASKQNPGDLHNFGQILITVGSAPPAGQDRVVVQFKKALLATENKTNHKIEITKGNQAVLTFDAAVQQTGMHDATFDPLPAQWTIVTPPVGFNAQTGSIGHPSHNDVKITVQPTASATETPLKIKVNSQADGTLKGEAVVILKPM